MDGAIAGDDVIGEAIGELAKDVLIVECEEGDEECEKANAEAGDFLDFVDGAIAGDDVIGEAIGDIAKDVLIVECEEGDEECL